MYMVNKELKLQVVNPKTEAKASVIWLHGLGASGDDFLPMVDYFQFCKMHNEFLLSG